jgi:hypothetical protein
MTIDPKRRRYVASVPEIFDLALNDAPYLMKRNGTGSARHETPAKILEAGATLRFLDCLLLGL